MATMIILICSVVCFIFGMIVMAVIHEFKHTKESFGTILIVEDSFMLEISRDKKEQIKHLKTVLLDVETIVPQEKHIL